MTDLQKQLFSMQDEKYRLFHSRLMPTVDPETIIGVRTPLLRKFAKEFAKTPQADAFINTLPHKYYEENNLHAFILETEKDFDTAVLKTDLFLPYINNWATCDTFVPKTFKKNTQKLTVHINRWLKSDKTYTVRYALGLLMGLYLDDNFTPDVLQRAAAVVSDEYYINMMLAWLFATALCKQYDEAITYITDKKLSKWVHNKTIQKAIESYRISDETKQYLRRLKI